MKGWAQVALLLFAGCFPELARAQALSATPAQSPPRALGLPAATLIVVVADEPGDAVSARLERDLGSLGLSVMVLRATPENSSDSLALERCARGFGGVAAIRIWSDARGSELWAFDPATQRALSRSLVRPADANADANEIALGTVELLRASLMELHPPPPRLLPRARVPESSNRAHAHGSRFSLSGAMALELGLRSVGPSLATSWAASFRVQDCLGARAFVTLPLGAEKSALPEGRVEVEPLILGAGFACNFAHDAARIWPRLSLGVAGTHLATRGIASDPTRSQSAATWLAGGFGMFGLGLRLSRDVHVDLDATFVLLPAPGAIIVDHRQVGTWGAPAGFVALGVEVSTGP